MDQLANALQRAYEFGKSTLHDGQVASYIPELSKAEQSRLGIVVITSDGGILRKGETEPSFTLQSVTKVISLTLALARLGPDAVFARVGMEPTGDPFNSLVDVEEASAKPLNPMINSGAIAVCSLLVECLGADAAWDALYQLALDLCRPEHVSLDLEVCESERAAGHRNRALSYLLKELGIVQGSPDEALELYFRMCSLQTTCKGLAHMAYHFAHPNALISEMNIPTDVVRTVNTFLVTCGMYNASGEFAIKAGIPAKSGVSGAIMAHVPGRMGIGIVGPSLDERGNSIGGFHALVVLSQSLNLSIF